MRRFHPWLLVSWLGLMAGIFTPVQASEHWTKIETTYFTLYAECGPREATDWASSFEEFRRYMNEFLVIPPIQLQPLTIVVFKDREQLKHYFRRTKDKTPSDLAAMSVTLPAGTIIATSLNWDDDETRRLFYHMGTYWVLSGFKYPGPAWFQSGLAAIFENFQVSFDEVKVGEVMDGDVAFLHEHNLMALNQLFGIEYEDLDFKDETRVRLFGAESWALVHYLIFGRESTRGGTTRAPQLADFMEALQRGEPAEPAFKRVFGTDYDGMLRRLDAYVSSGHYAISTGKFNRAATSGSFRVAAASPAETEIIHGYACLAGNWNDQARRLLLVAQSLPGGELPAEELLGDMAMQERNEGEAGAHYARAIELGSKSYRAYFFVGNQIFDGAPRGAASLPLRFEPQLARASANRFEQAINLYPRYLPSYEKLALLMPSLEITSTADRQFLELGKREAPNDDVIEAGLGVWEMKNHQEKQGQQRLSALLVAGKRASKEARAMAQDLAATEAAGEGISAARKLLAEDKADEAGELVAQLLRNCTDERERASLVALRGQIGQLDLVLQAEQLAGEKQWEVAASMAQSVLDTNPPPALRQRAQAVLTRVQTRQ